ncbi:SDR family oxidoreductase [Escherichia coli]|uniref:SDR family oxidoreductase n=1 Tax=Escherichia coli TaxID=562 RepID=UPI0003EF846F|nr:SDR family oxidoreductase [Escherichia coli]EED0460661.1 SDR family oxidoreductase [Escherichia coli]EER0975815.1 SDR family oxidoreductase [Escherichia coli]EET9428905.1 SDR family oxidoreductase [Escherichia coli]EFD5186857.1 SDR family oxidoreductase [Escherichia coli]EFD5242319.1 SDR family oxidoreductase [Escherichia coli]
MQTWLNLQDKIIIVTGGASGIGLAIVEELLAQGANVQMVDIHGGDGQYEGHKGYQFWPTDISSAKEVNHTVAEIIQRFGRIDGLVNNAGVNFPRLLVDEKAPAGQYELNEAAFEKMVNINQKGVFLMSQALAWTRNITVEQLREGYTKNAIPIGRAGRLAEVADFVCYLLSERASYITGVTTNIAGGKTRG